MNPVEPAKRIGTFDRLDWPGGGESRLPEDDIRADRDRAWRRRWRARARRMTRVASLMLGDAIAVVAGLTVAGLIASAVLPLAVLANETYRLLPPGTPPAFLALQALTLAAIGAYGGRPANPMLRVGVASLIASALFFLGLSRYSNLNLPWETVTLVAGSAILALLIGRRIARSLYKTLRWLGLGLPRVALITTPAGAKKDAERIARMAESHVRVCQTVIVERPTNGGRKLALNALDRISRDTSLAGVVVSVDAPPRLMRAVLDGCLERGLPLFVVPPFQQVFSADVRAVTTGSLTVIELVRPAPALPELALKRVIDMVGAAVGLLVTAPVMLLLSLLIKLDSPGPVFFSQTRVGLGGRPFQMLKFRTMIDGADSRKKDVARLNGSGDARLFKVERDPRVTRLGGFLRKYSLDELPQLWNVLRREMSLVGPRPFFVEDLEHYEPHHFQRYSVLPGITGQWQVNGRSSIRDFETVVAQDLDYIRNWSVRRDLLILFKTLPAVLRAEGAM